MTDNTRSAVPSGSILSTFDKLGDCDIFRWKRNVIGYIKAIGLGKFMRSSIPAPTDPDELDQFEMQREQVMIAIRATIDSQHAQHIDAIDDPFLAVEALERRHGVNTGLSAANLITKIVNNKYDSSTRLEDYVSSTQALHNQVAQTIPNNSKLKLSEQILALLVLTNLPRDQFAPLIQQPMGDMENITTAMVFNRLLTEAQLVNSISTQEPSIAFAAQQQSPKYADKSTPKTPISTKGGDRSSTAPDALCCMPGHQFSLHTNSNCNAQRSSASKSGSRLISRANNTSNAANKPHQSKFTNAEKVRLFDKAYAARADGAASKATANAAVAMADNSDDDEEVVELTTAYTMIASNPNLKRSDLYMDTGTNRDLLNDKTLFTSLRPTRPVRIRSANGAADLVAHEVGNVIITTYNADDSEHKAEIVDALYCRDVAVNLVSATQHHHL